MPVILWIFCMNSQSPQESQQYRTDYNWVRLAAAFKSSFEQMRRNVEPALFNQPVEQPRDRIECIGFSDQAWLVGELSDRSDAQSVFIGKNEGQGKEWPKRSSAWTAAVFANERRKALQWLQQCYVNKQTFHGSSKSNRKTHNAEFLQKCAHMDIRTKIMCCFPDIFLRIRQMHDAHMIQ